jgi:hypothetical protein
VFGNYFYNQYYYMNCYWNQNYCYDNYGWYNQYINYNQYYNNPTYLNEYVCASACSGRVSGPTTSTSNYLFYQTIYQPSPSSSYTAIFQEYGLPQGSTWSVTVGGISYSSSSNSLTVNGLSGTVNYFYQTSASNFECQSSCSGSISGSSTLTGNYYPATYQYATVTYTSPVPEFSSTPFAILAILAIIAGVMFHSRSRNNDSET